MEARIREVLINWAKLKDQIPPDNSEEDPLYSQKLSLLYAGQESLNHSSYQEWSTRVETPAEPIEISDFSFTQGECLAGVIVSMVEERLSIDSWDDERATNIQWLAFKAMWHAIESLSTFSSMNLVEALHGQTRDENNPSHQQIEKSIDVIEKRYLLAMMGSVKGDASPLHELCDATFTTLLHAKQVSTILSKGKQQREAAYKKHEPNRNTKAYAITLHDEGKWKSSQNGVDQIQNKVMAYGIEVGMAWTTDHQANRLIYSWILDHVNGK
jgi:hypothetical protein